MELALFTKKKLRNEQEIQFEVLPVESLFDQSVGRNSLFYGGDSIIWIVKGAGHMNLDAETFEIEDDTVYYTRPAKTLILKINQDAKGFIINYGPEFLNLNEPQTSKLVNSFLGNYFSTVNIIRINEGADILLRNLVGNMMTEFQNVYDLRAEILKELLILFILQLRRKTTNKANVRARSRKTDIVNAFYHLLKKQITPKKMVKDYAKSLSVTPHYLNDTVKELSGFSASFHIQQRIVLEAKRRAISDGDSLKEIAYQLGFWDPAHFSKYFKNGSGMNFTDFKKGLSDFC